MIADSTNSEAVNGEPRKSRRLLRTVLCLGIAGCISYSLWSDARSPDKLIKQAKAAFAQQDFETAEKFASLVLKQLPNSTEAALLAGRAAAGRKQFEAAHGYFERVPDNGSRQAVTARSESGNIMLLELKRPTSAEELYRRAYAQDSENLIASYRLAYLLGMCGRNRDAIPFRLKLIELDQFESLNLYLLCTGDTVLENLESLKELYQSAPDDPLPQLGMARSAINQQDTQQALNLLKKVIAVRPELYEAQVKLGGLLLDAGAESEFLQWRSILPKGIKTHPKYWVVLGDWAQSHVQTQAAIRCFWEAVRIDPSHERANYQLSQLLIAEGSQQQAEVFLNRSRSLERYYTAVKIAWTGEDMPAVKQAVNQAELLGMIWEAYGWSRLMIKHFPETAWAQRAVRRLKPRLSTLTLTRTIPKENPANAVDLSDFPLPNFPSQVEEPHSSESLVSETETSGDVRFIDQASEAGISFSYFNGADRKHQTRKMYEPVATFKMSCIRATT